MEGSMLDKVTLGLSTTVIGMLVVFFGLFLLIFCISIMGKINARVGKKKEQAPAEVIPEPQPQTVEETEEVTDDTELIAVITAAISAVWDQKDGGFTVRRVRRINNTPVWQKNAREEQIYSRM